MDRDAEHGAALVLVAIVVPILLLLIAGAVDIGRIILARTELQRTTDAAALSSVAGVPNLNRTGSQLSMKSLAEEFNGPPGADNPFVNDIFNTIRADIDFSTNATIVRWGTNGSIIDNPPSNLANGVRITKNIQVPSTFSSLLGFGQYSITTSSTAILGAPDCFPVNFPVVLMNCEGTNNLCTYGGCNQVIPVVFTPSTVDNAAIFASQQPASAQECRNTVNGQGTNKCSGDPIYLNNGQVTSCLQDMVDRCTALGQCTPSNPMFVHVPFVNCADYSGNMNQQVQIRGFARVAVIRVDASGSNKGIDVVRICDTMSFGAPGGGQHCGLYTPPRLIQ